MFHYRAYELTFASDIELPDVLPAEAEPDVPDVTIRTGLTPEHLDGQQDRTDWFQTGARQFLLRIEGVARYLVEDGNRITVTTAAGSDPDLVRLYLLGSTTGALLYQRGLLPLHGSAVETPRGAMVFIGPQGSGKSTLAAHLLRRGYRILSDDVCVIAPDAGGQLQVLPAFAKIRLCPDAIERLGHTLGNPGRARFDGDKFIVPVNDRRCPHPVPLAAIHLLSAGSSEAIIIRPFSGFGRADCLLSNLYRPEYLHGLESEAYLCGMALTIAGRARLVEIVHDRNAERIEALVDRLEKEWLSR